MISITLKYVCSEAHQKLRGHCLSPTRGTTWISACWLPVQRQDYGLSARHAWLLPPIQIAATESHDLEEAALASLLATSPLPWKAGRLSSVLLWHSPKGSAEPYGAPMGKKAWRWEQGTVLICCYSPWWWKWVLGAIWGNQGSCRKNKTVFMMFQAREQYFHYGQRLPPLVQHTQNTLTYTQYTHHIHRDAYTHIHTSIHSHTNTKLYTYVHT